MKNVKGAVTASTAHAAAAGEEILRKGGNAVDAAVATALASCVCDPANTGLGGFGGHMIVAAPARPPACIDFNVWTPVAAVPSYDGIKGVGPKASVIPNVVAGLSAALDAFGSLRWEQVIAPAIALAEKGFTVGTTLERALRDVKGMPFVDECFSFEQSESGLQLCQPALARTLRDLAERGPQWFYTSPLAKLGSRALSHAGHETSPGQWAEALEAVSVAAAPSHRANGVNFHSSPLGTSGSICMFATVDAGAKLAGSGDLESPAAIRAWAERLAAAWSYRFDAPDGNSIAEDDIEAWIARATAFAPTAARTEEISHTCHLNAADRDGMIVATTFTHGMLWFGARWAMPGTGIIMNYGGRAVSGASPIICNGRACAITNMNPTIALADDGAAVAIGSPGARRISTIVGLVLARHFFAGVPLQEALTRGRFHAESGGRATLEMDRFPPAVAAALRDVFAVVETELPESYYGPCTAIRRDADGAMTFGLDDRWKGHAAIVADGALP
jgi:gamma-glutamyltranspeptidase/glutathione hydrolase